MLVGMFCCGRGKNEDQSMAQGPINLRNSQSKDLPVDHHHKQQQHQQQQQSLAVSGNKRTVDAQGLGDYTDPLTRNARSKILNDGGSSQKVSHHRPVRSLSESGGTIRRKSGVNESDDRQESIVGRTVAVSDRWRGATSNVGGLDMGIKSMEVQDDSFVVETVEITKRPGQTLGFYIREGNGFDRFDGVFISRIQMGTVAESNGLLHVGDEIVTVNNVRVSNMSLDDVVILMSIPKKLVLTIRTRRNSQKNKSCPSLALTERDEQPVVVLKKGRSSSATALEVTEKYPEVSDPYLQQRLHSAHFVHSKPQTAAERSLASRYASIFISPERAHARLLTGEDGLDSGNSSDISVPLSVVGDSERPYTGNDLCQYGASDRPATYFNPAGDREYLKYLHQDNIGRKIPPKAPPKSATLGAHASTHSGYMSDESAVCSEPPYMNIGPYREGLPIPHYHEDRKSQERLRDLLHSKSRYNRLLRSRSPECYNSDSEVIFTHQRPADYRGFASDYETYAGAFSDDDGPVYSIPRIPSSSSSELEALLQKFTSLSHDLQQEQSKLQRQLSSRDKARLGHNTLGRPADQTVAGGVSPGPSHRGVSTGTQTPTGDPGSRPTRKPSTESTFLFRQLSLDDSLDSGKEQLHQQQKMTTGGNVLVGASSQRHLFLTSGQSLSTTSHGTLPTAATDRSKHQADSLSSVRLRDLHFSRKPLHIPYSEFEPYKADIHKRVEINRAGGLDGMLNIHIMSGQGLKSSKTSLRDLYCVVAVDSLNKARTMIRTGAINFDWDEAFDVDLEDSKEVSFLIYHWDPSYKHRLCFHGSVLLPGYVSSGQRRYVAIKMEPKGILFVTLLYKEPALSLQRLPSLRKNALFGVDLESVIERESSGLGVPLLVRKCVDEVEARGLETVGIYRLCGSARRKLMLREAFEKNAAVVSLTPDNVSDIHVVTGVLKDYLRELPEPLFTNALYQMLLDALSVRLPSDPEGSAKLMLSILECLPTPNQDTMALILNHLRRVAALSHKNKMTIHNLAICFGPVLLCPAPSTTSDLAVDFSKHIEVLRYLLEIWEYDNGASKRKVTHVDAVEPVDLAACGMTGLTTQDNGTQRPPTHD